MATLTDEDLALVRTAALRVPLCCPPGAEPCDRCRVVHAVEALVLEVERARAGRPPAPIQVTPSELHQELAVMTRVLTRALGRGTPMTEEAHVALSQVEELIERIDEIRGPVPPSGTTKSLRK